MARTETKTENLRMEFTIEGMDCGDCAITIEKAVSAIPGVEAASVNFGAARLTVKEASGAQPGLERAIARKVSEAGYRATPASRRGQLAQAPFWRRERRVLTTAAGVVFALLAFALSLLRVQ